jgi:hypothetical protein
MQNWSETHLGQWHYVLGYVIVLISHNWPIMLAIGGCVWFSYNAYRTPNRLWVSWLITALIFGLAYEFHKHVAPTLQEAVDFLFLAEINPLNRFFHLLVGPVANGALTAGWLAFLVEALRQTLLWRAGAAALHSAAPAALSPTNPQSSRSVERS